MSKLFARVVSQQSKTFLQPKGIERSWLLNGPTLRGAATSRATDPMKGKGPITWKSFALIATAGLGSLGFMWYVKDEKEQGKSH